MADQESGLPLEFYGKNYLGKPVSVPLVGESPSGATGSAGAKAAVSAPGGTGPASTGGAPASSVSASLPGGGASALEDLAKAVQGLQYGRLAGDVGEKVTDKLSTPAAGAPNTQPLDPAAFGFDPDTLGSLGTSEFEQFTSGIPRAGTQGAAVNGATTNAAGATTGVPESTLAGTLAPVVLPALAQAAFQFAPTPAKGGIASGSTASALTAGGTKFTPGDIAMNLLSGGLGFLPFGLTHLISGLFSKDPARAIFGGPAPAMAFPAQTWGAITSQVANALPKKLEAPDTLAPEQRALVDQANGLIDALGAYSGPMPSYLGGKQSAETWQNTMNTIRDDITSKFTQLQGLYPKAQSALSSDLATQADKFYSSTPTAPQGAPAGLLADIQAPANAVTSALAAGDVAKARALIHAGTGSSEEALKRYAPELTAGQTTGGDFYDTRKQREAAA